MKMTIRNHETSTFIRTSVNRILTYFTSLIYQAGLFFASPTKSCTRCLANGPSLCQDVCGFSQEVWHLCQDIWQLCQDNWHLNQDFWHLNQDKWHLSWGDWHLCQNMPSCLASVAYEPINRHLCHDAWHYAVMSGTCAMMFGTVPQCLAHELKYMDPDLRCLAPLSRWPPGGYHLKHASHKHKSYHKFCSQNH